MKAIVFLLVLLVIPISLACLTPDNNAVIKINQSEVLCSSIYTRVRVQMNSDSITLDCNGTTLDGINRTSNMKAIEILSGNDNTTVKNCVIKNYDYGYYISQTEFTMSDSIINSTFYNNTYGIQNTFNYYLTVLNNTFNLNDFGISARTGDFYHIEGNTFIDQKWAGVIFDSSVTRSSAVRNNIFRNNRSATTYAQIYIDSQLSNSEFTGNVVEYSKNPALTLASSYENINLTISYNNFTNINSSGMKIYRLQNSVVAGNYINSTFYSGIELGASDAQNNTIANNTVMNGLNFSYGIYVFNSLYTSTITGNYVSGSNYPIYIASSSSFNIIVNNIFNKSQYDPYNFNETNEFNSSLDCSTNNIMGGTCTGGNYYAASGTGFSDTCADADLDGFCDSTYNASGIIDYHPLSSYIYINDTRKPGISGISIGSITNVSAIISWTTDETANSTVYYGTTIAFGSKSESSSYTTSHSRTLNSLSSGTIYYYNISSCDSSGNCNISGIYNFTTLTNSQTNISINWSEWNSLTTNFSSYSNSQLSNISNVTFSNTYGRITYLEPLALTQNRNLSGHIIVLSNSIFVNSSQLPEFNKSALLRFSGISMTNPVVKRDGSDCSSYCQNNSYNSSNNSYSVIITSFSTYTLAEQCSDSIENYDETGVDCGGSCSACSVAQDSDAGTSGGGGGGGASGGTVVGKQNTTNNTTDFNITGNFTNTDEIHLVTPGNIQDEAGTGGQDGSENEPANNKPLSPIAKFLTASFLLVVIAAAAVYLRYRKLRKPAEPKQINNQESIEKKTN